MNDPTPAPAIDLGRRLTEDVLTPMKGVFVGKDEIIDLLGVCLIAGENLFLHGPPGTAKSAPIQDLAGRLEGRVFDYLLTRFTEPNELFGPFDIRKLREGELVTNTEGMLPEASFVFLDELLNANSAILNSLLMVLNERVFRRGRETRELPLLMVVGASNRLPEDDALGALFDRFLLRVRCDNVPAERMPDVLVAGWKLDLKQQAATASFHVDDVRRLHALLGQTDLNQVRQVYVELIHRLRYAGIAVSDRRAVKLQRLMAASALLCSHGGQHHGPVGAAVHLGQRGAARDPGVAGQRGDRQGRGRRAVAAASPFARRGVAGRGSAGPRSRAHRRASGRPFPGGDRTELSPRPARAAGGSLPMDERRAAARVFAAAGRCAVDEAGRTPMIAWAVRLPAAEARVAVRLWRVAGVEVCPLVDGLWLRGGALDERLEQRLRSLPNAERFEVLSDGQLRSPGALLPRGWLPRGPWVKLREWLATDLPPGALPGRGVARVLLQLVRAGRAEEPAALLTTIDRWRAYAAAAPQVRLERWQFAAADDGRVLVRGRPLPPIPGQGLVESAGVLVPAGWTWSPAVEAEVVRSVWGLESDELLIWHTDGTRRAGGDAGHGAGHAVRRAAHGGGVAP